jgi:hypothetical protein
MTKSYSEENKRETIHEPNLSRQRLPFLGPIPSQILNLYQDQFIVDSSRLSDRADRLTDMVYSLSVDYSSDFNLDTPNQYRDQTIDATLYFNYINYDRELEDYTFSSSTPYYESSLIFNKYGINAASLALSQHKIKILEDLIGKKE